MRFDRAVIVDQRRERNMRLVVRKRSNRAAFEQLEEAVLREGQDVAHRADDEPLQSAAAQHARHIRIELREIERHHDLDAGIGDQVSDFALGIERIEVDDDAARLEHGVVADDVIGRVGQRQTDPRALADADRAKSLGGARDKVTDFGKAVSPSQEIETGSVAETPERVIEKAVDRARSETGLPSRLPLDKPIATATRDQPSAVAPLNGAHRGML